MTVSLDYYTREYEDFLSEDFCKQLIFKYERLMDTEFENVKAKSGCRGTCTHCTCHRMDLNNHQIFNSDVQFVASQLIRHLDTYKNDVKLDPIQWPKDFNFEFLKIKRYTPGEGRFLPHVDGSHIGSAKRFMVFLIYLNDDFKGGRTIFNLTGKTVEPKTGKLLMFPPHWPWLHEGELVEDNYKYFLGTYLTFKE